MSEARPAPLPMRDGAYDSILDAIGNTPLVRLRLPGIPDGVELFGKCEWFNPGLSLIHI